MIRPHRLYPCFLAFFIPLATSGSASASVWGPQPDTSIVRGNEVERLSLTGGGQVGSGDLTFGAGYAFDTAMIVTDYDLQCVTSDPYAMCGSWGVLA